MNRPLPLARLITRERRAQRHGDQAGRRSLRSRTPRCGTVVRRDGGINAMTADALGEIPEAGLAAVYPLVA
jgi:hypothetical protein